jgi:aspartate/methionine/tyrosine aminotransferase
MMSPPLSRRIAATDEPIIAIMRTLASGPNILSLGQGAVHWAPPEKALDAARDACGDPATSTYSDDLGTPALRAALRAKLAADHGLPVVGGEVTHSWAYDIAVTAGANQALASLALILTDPATSSSAPPGATAGVGVAILFAPYYFNSLMALQLAGSAVEIGPCDAGWSPDLGWLEARMKDGAAPPVSMVYAVSPGNPTGVALPRSVLDTLVRLTSAANAWLVLDITYEAFTDDPLFHALPASPNLVYVGSFSKAFGAAGWRVGWVAFPEDGRGELMGALLKTNDTLPIHAALASQAVAQACLEGGGCGRAWVRAQVAGLASSRSAARAALEPLVTAGGAVAGGDAIYWWVTLPPGCEDDGAFVRWLVGKHGVAVVPGSACGASGHVRVAFGKPAPGPAFEGAAARLRAGCEELAEAGMAGVRGWLEERERSGG